MMKYLLWYKSDWKRKWILSHSYNYYVSTSSALHIIFEMTKPFFIVVFYPTSRTWQISFTFTNKNTKKKCSAKYSFSNWKCEVWIFQLIVRYIRKKMDNNFYIILKMSCTSKLNRKFSIKLNFTITSKVRLFRSLALF